MTVPIPKIATRGPVFDGRAARASDAFLDEAKMAIGEQGVNDVLSILSTSLKNPTGFYESQIQTDQAKSDVTVHDSGVIYGPWLEGVTSRNQSTRFKGYSHFRRATQKLQNEAKSTAERVLPPFLARMN